jgi:hypothetical protein
VALLHRSALHVGRDNSIGIATRYGLDSPEIHSRWGEIFRSCLDRLWVPPASSTVGTESFLGVKRPGRSVDHPPPSSAEFKKRGGLQLVAEQFRYICLLGLLTSVTGSS